MSLFEHQNIIGAAAAGGGAGAVFDKTLIGNSVWFDGSSDQLEMAKTSGGSASSKFTVSCWVQRNEFTESPFAGIFGHFYNSSTGVQLYWSSADKLVWTVFSSVSGSGSTVTTNEVFRDVGWYHILANYDGTNGRMQLFVNGELVGSNDVGEKRFTAGSTNPIGSGTGGASYYWGAIKNTAGTFGRTNSYLAQCALELGTAAVPSDYVDTFTFGTNGSQVIPKKSSDLVARINSAGGHSHLLDFSDASNLGNDISSNNNDFTATSMSTANHSSNTPSLVYPLLNPLSAAFTTPLSNGSTTASGSSGNGDDINPGIIIPKTGKWVWQITNTTQASLIYGVRNFADMKAASYDYTNLYGFYTHNGTLVQGGGPSGSYLDAASGGDVYQIYYDADTRKMWVSDNGVIPNSGNPDAGSNEAFTIPDSGFDLCPTALVGSSTPNSTFDFGMDGVTLHANGQNFKPLTSANLPAPDYQGIDYFDSTLYDGNGTGQRVGDFVPFTDVYTVTNSAMFEHDDVRNLSRTIEAPSSTGGKKGTWSAWFKTANIDTDNVIFDNGTTATNRFSLNMDASGQLIFSHKAVTILKTSGDFKGDGAWHNVVLKVDTSLATAADRAVMFVDGVQITSFEEDRRDNSNFTQHDEIGFMDENATQFVGSYNNSSANQWDGYLAELVFLDNQFLDASSFGQTDTSTNRWVAKDPGSLTFGNSGFYLEFKIAPGTGNGAGTDTSGNSNHFTSNGSWATTDQFTDAPSKNFCTWDQGRKTGHTLSEGNLKATGDGGADFDTALGTMFVSSGKYYWEINRDNDPAGTDRFRTGVAQDSLPTLIVDDGKDVFGLSENGQIHGGGLALTNYGDSTTTGDYIGVALDMDRNAIYFSKNGTWMNSASASGIADGSDLAKAAHTNVIGSVTPFISTYDTQVATLRTASGRWEGTAPTGFLELNQDNLDATASKLTAWAWIKNRDADDNHMLLDRVRGVNKDLHSNSTAAEATNANTLQRFLQRGVQVGSDVEVNTVNESYVLWQWLLGNSATTGSTNSDGSVDTTVIAADAGHFSVVKGTTGSSGATFGHGLGAAPDLIINKNLTDGSSNWLVYNSISGATYYLALNLTNSKFGPGSTVFGTEPTSTVFTLGSFFNSVECINYCFRSIPGVCKVGSYEGNNNADGTYVSLGFTPAWVLTKNIDGTAAWGIMDNAREPNNAVVKRLFANANSAEDEDGEQMDFLSDGFKLRKTGGFNSAQTYIYLAMADIAGNGTLPPIYGR